MKVITEKDNLEFDRKSVVTVGTFDGVHIGHRQIIEKLNEIKKLRGLRSVLVTFEPHPRIVLKNHGEVKILTTLDEKLKIFESLGIDIVFLISFTKEFASTSAEDFYKNYLIEKTGLSELVLGYDHTFGKNREGNFGLLRDLSVKYNFGIHKIEEYKLGDEHVSSTVIRKAILSGDVKQASKLLGSEYILSGKVIQGDRRGATLGFPTANLKPDSDYKLIPGNGVYVVTSEIGGKEYYGMMNIGTRPTVEGSTGYHLEVHFFDFDKDIYGEMITVKFIDFIRAEQKFDSLETLMGQLKKDKQYTLNITKEIHKIH